MVDPVTHPHPAQAWLERVLHLLESQRSGQGKWQCPAHARTGDHSPSLAVGTRDDRSGAWVQCHAGCSMREIMSSLKLNLNHLHDPPPVDPDRYVRLQRLERGFPTPKIVHGSPREAGYRHECFHYYGTEHRKERLRHPNTGEKWMLWESHSPHGGWVPGLLGKREATMPLYRESELQIAMVTEEPILLVESESSVDALKGWYATTWAGGAGSPHLLTIRRVLLDYDKVVILGDNDEAGRACAQQLSNALPLARVLIPDKPGEDARDLLTRLGPEDFTRRVHQTLEQDHAADRLDGARRLLATPGGDAAQGARQLG